MNNADQMASTIANAIDENMQGMGKINILIAGKTGVGKSTLINTVFRSNLAKVGHGKPVTQGVEEITKDGLPLTIFDTKGLELEDYDQILLEITDLIDSKNSSIDSNEHIHLAWLCISSSSHRLEDAEERLLEVLQEKHIPSIVVMTKYLPDEQSRNFAEFVGNRVKPYSEHLVPVRALPLILEEEGVTLSIFGIDSLISKTGNIVPEAKKKAYANALSTEHKQALELKKQQANKEVNIATGLAASAAAVPVPFSDAVTLVPIQIGMIAKIGSTFGMELSTNTISTLVASAVGSSTATVVGRTLVTGLLKMVPGVGSAVGGTIAATTAAAITKALGNAYISILYEFVSENPGKEIDVSLIGRELKKRTALFSKADDK